MRELDSPQGVSCSKLHCGVVPAIRLSKVLLPKGKPNRVYVCVCVSVCVQMKDLLCLCVIVCMSSQVKDVNRLSGLSVPGKVGEGLFAQRAQLLACRRSTAGL